MSVSIAERLLQWLIDEGELSDPEAGAGEWPVFLGSLPDNDEVPNNIVAIYDTSGTQDGRLMETGERIEHPGFQIRVRALGYRVGFTKAKELAAKLDELLKVTVTIDDADYGIKSITRTGTILSIGQETEGRRRHGFTVNGIGTL